MYPVAYAVVEVESKNSWIWFLELLIADLKIENGKAWVFISDKQKGIIPAIETLLPTAEHRMCVRHMYSNFRTEHAGLALKNILWAAARATTIPWYDAEMEKMKQQDEGAWKWLIKRPAKNWSRSHFEPDCKCDMLLNNLCESFNSCILDSRDKSILTCLERIRVYIMLRMANRRIYVKVRCSVCGQEGHNKTRHENEGAAQAQPNQPNPTIGRGRGRGRGTTTGMASSQPFSYTGATSSSSQPPNIVEVASQPSKSPAKRFKAPANRVKSPAKRFKSPAKKLRPWMW
ncbi:hypothetical protein ACE6H2_007355 [Prunus campanulata]